MKDHLNLLFLVFSVVNCRAEKNPIWKSELWAKKLDVPEVYLLDSGPRFGGKSRQMFPNQ